MKTQSLLLPLIIIGGIRLGVFTPTEAGQVTAFLISSVSNKYVFLLIINVFLLFPSQAAE
jgi:TRAP-type C4-dicarboxylate transport system permease large subunit